MAVGLWDVGRALGMAVRALGWLLAFGMAVRLWDGC